MENHTCNCCNSCGNKDYSKKDKAILTSVNDGVKMAIESICTLLTSIKNTNKIVYALKKQLDQYRSVEKEVKDALQVICEEADEVNILNKAMLYTSIKISTLTDSSDSHIADMMIKGTNMGVVEITKTMNEHRESANLKAVKLGEHMLDLMSKFVEEIKIYL